MKKTTRKLLALYMAVAILAGMATTAFAASSTMINLKSSEGGFNDYISVSNVVGTDSREYIEDAPTYLCNSPVEVELHSDINVFDVQKLEVIDGVWTRTERMPAEGQVTIYIWDEETQEEKEITTSINDSFGEEEIGPPLTYAGAKVTLSEKGIYVVRGLIVPLPDYIEAVIVVGDGNLAPTAVQATPTASNVLVNGKQTAFDAYNIGGNNFFKLRDLAYALNGSGKQFEVKWDGANNAILLTSGTRYTPVGGEMEGKGAGAKTAATTSSKILLDGKEITLTAYNIGGNNYFKLRDIGQAYDFSVTWDGVKNTISIDTAAGYTE